MDISRRNNRFLATLAVGLVIVAAACGGGGDSNSDGERDRNISGGVVADQSAHPAPYQVAIYMMDPDREATKYDGSDRYDYQQPGNWVFVCSGVVIGSEWVALPNNCVNTGGKLWRNDRFHIGVGQVGPWAPIAWENRSTYIYGISGMVSSGGYANYALLKTDKPFDFENIPSLRPIDLPFGLDGTWPAKGTIGQISGWGFRESRGRVLETLRTAQVEVLNEPGVNECGSWNDVYTESRLCLGKAKTATGGLACPGDMGGPVVVNVADKPVLAGIISEVDRVGTCDTDGATLALATRPMLQWLAKGGVTDVTATPGDGVVTLTWSAPTGVWFKYPDDGWNPGVFDYQVEISLDGGKNWMGIADDVSTTREVTAIGLENGEEYSFRVAAITQVLANRADYRWYSPVVTATAGKQEPPANIVDDPWWTPPAEVADIVPTIDGQAPMGEADVVPPPASTPSAGSATTSPAVTAAGGSPVTTAAASPAATGAPYVPPATTSTSAEGVVSAASTNLSTLSPIQSTAVAKIAKLEVPTGAQVSVTIDKSSKKVCTVKGTAVTALKAGKCKVKVTVAGAKGKGKSKTTTLTVAN